MPDALHLPCSPYHHGYWLGMSLDTLAETSAYAFPGTTAPLPLRRRGRRVRSTSGGRWRAGRTELRRPSEAPKHLARERDRNRRGLGREFVRDGPWRGRAGRRARSPRRRDRRPAPRSPRTRRPERHQRKACARPTNFGRNQALPASGTRPRRAKMKPSFAPVAAMRTSIGSVMVRPTPTAGAVDRRDRRLAAGENRADKAAAAALRDIYFAAKHAGPVRAGRVETGRAARDVRAGTERPARAGDDQRAHRVVGVRAPEGILELGAHGARYKHSAYRADSA